MSTIEGYGKRSGPHPFLAKVLGPWGLLAIVFWILWRLNSAWIYSSIGRVDAWAYLGLALDPIGMRFAFPTHPATDLLPLIWPPALLYAVFPPFVANLLYKGATFTLVGLLLYRVVEQDFGWKTALWATVTLVFNKYFLTAVGADYTDGRVIVFLTGTLYFLSVAHADHISLRGEWLRFFLAGISFCFCIGTALLSVIFALPLAILAIGRQWIKKGAIAFSSLAFAVVGFAFGILILGVGHYLYTGRFCFWEATLVKASMFLQMTRGPQDFQLWTLEWMYLPFLACLAFPLSLAMQRGQGVLRNPENRLPMLLWLANTIAVSLMAYLQYFRRQETLTNSVYCDQILPITVMTLAATVIHPAIRQCSRRTFAILTVVLVFVCFAAFAYTTRSPAITDERLRNFLIIGTVTAVCLFCMARPNAGWLTVLLTLFLMGNLSPVWLDMIWKQGSIGPYSVSRKQVLDTTCRWVTLMKEIDPQRSCYLWYNAQNERWFLRCFSAASHLWQGRLLNEGLPQVDGVTGDYSTVDARLLASQNESLILITGNDRETEIARENLLKQGIRTECTTRRTFQVNDQKSLQVSICRLALDKPR